MDEIGELRARLNRMDEYTVQLGTRIMELEKKLEENAPSAKPLPEGDENGHVIVEEKKRRSKLRHEALTSKGLIPGEGLNLVITCNEKDCVAGDHLELMTSAESRRFNSERVGEELASLDRATVAFVFDSLTTEVNDGHRIPNQAQSYLLPSGRFISFFRVAAWVHSDLAGVPRKISRECDRPDCVEPSHLNIDELS